MVPFILCFVRGLSVLALAKVAFDMLSGIALCPKEKKTQLSEKGSGG